MSNSTIISLAILKVNWDSPESKDYLENFVPLVGESVRLSADDVISIPNLQKDLETRFGLGVPQNALRSILKRLKRHGYVRQENKVLHPVREQLDLLNFAEVQKKVLAMEESLVKNLVSFVLERFHLSWSQAEAEAALLDYLEENQLVVFHAIQVSSQVNIPDEEKIRARYVVGSFIRSLQESESSDFDSIDVIVKGSMLANAVYLPDPDRVAKKFAKTDVFFDTSLIVYALGYGGDLRRAPCTELLELLYEVGGNLKCFQHTAEEVHGILDACAFRLKRGSLKDAYGPSMEYFIEKGFTASDIELFKSRLHDDIKALRIEIVNKPAYEERYVIDEAGFQNRIAEDIHYGNPKALQRDVDSISAVMRARRGQHCYTFEECRALFVTTNRELVCASRGFLYEPASAGALPPAITDYDLTTLLWLKRPMEAPDLPRKRIIADCYAATKPSDRLWQKYMREVDKLETEKRITLEDVYTLRFSLEAKATLMELTYGDEGFFTEGTVQEILEIARDHIQREVREKLHAEVALREKAEGKLTAKLAEDESRRRQQTVRAQRWAKLTSRAIGVGLMTILLIGSLYSFPWGMPHPRTGAVRYGVSFSLAILFAVTLYNLWSERGVATIRRGLEVRLGRWLERRFLALAGLEDVPKGR